MKLTHKKQSWKTTGHSCAWGQIQPWASLVLVNYLAIAFSGKNAAAAAADAKSLQSCPTMCDPIDGSPPGSPIPGILQTRTLEWVAMSFSNAWKWKWKWSRSVVSDPQWPQGLQPTRLLCPWDCPGKSTGVGCHCLLRILLINCQIKSKLLWRKKYGLWLTTRILYPSIPLLSRSKS